jgi:hypothetical protein
MNESTRFGGSQGAALKRRDSSLTNYSRNPEKLPPNKEEIHCPLIPTKGKFKGNTSRFFIL